jgi:predicted nucleotidyltransferase component of viral defense system
MSASVNARLLRIAKEQREDFQLVLTRYAVERFLYRLGRSAYHQQFILKGATLFAYWTGKMHRPTRDLDLLGSGDSRVLHLAEIFAEICREAVEDDGLVFLSETIAGSTIRDEEEYSGVRITLVATLGNARIPLQVDIGFGDAITPSSQEIELPTLLNLPPARLHAYPRETVIAEKCEAIVHLGLANSRLKDFYDLWYLATHFDFDGQLLVRALIATLDRRKTDLPSQIPPALTSAYFGMSSRQTQWNAFVRKSNLPTDRILSLEEVVKMLEVFLMPLIAAARSDALFNQDWKHDSLSWNVIS